ncbi:MAG: mechanosensitive ion channel family protein [Deltaproteobacteria bacterium]|nr:mechanosensitive ion channel family protein [Deltaproteobacteria bacterium]
MTLWNAILNEAGAASTPVLSAVIFGLWVVARVLVQEGRRRIKTAFALGILHLILVIVAAWLFTRGAESVAVTRTAAQVCAAISITGLSVAIVFSGLLTRMGMRSPRILQDVTFAAASVIATLALATRAGFSLTGIVATSAVLTAVVGLAFQETLGNLVAGLAVQLDHSIRVGDWVTVGDTTGKVTEIRWRYTAIETRNWETLVVPNGQLVKGLVLVLGRRAGMPRLWRRWIWFNVDFRYEPTRVVEAVENALRSTTIESVASSPAPNCVLMELGESTARYAVRYHLSDMAVDDPTDSVVRTRVFFALQRAGIPLSIPAQALFLANDTIERRTEKARVDNARRVQVLAKIDLFSPLSVAEREHLASKLRPAPFAAGETITQQGAEAHWLYIVIRGRVVVRIEGPNGIEKAVATLGPGDFFGEMGLLTGESRSATVIAETDAECYRLGREGFEALLRERPEVAGQMAEALAQRRVTLDAAVADLSQAAKQAQLAAAKRDLLGKIRDFFGIAHE